MSEKTSSYEDGNQEKFMDKDQIEDSEKREAKSNEGGQFKFNTLKESDYGVIDERDKGVMRETILSIVRSLENSITLHSGEKLEWDISWYGTNDADISRLKKNIQEKAKEEASYYDQYYYAFSKGLVDFEKIRSDKYYEFDEEFIEEVEQFKGKEKFLKVQERIEAILLEDKKRNIMSRASIIIKKMSADSRVVKEYQNINLYTDSIIHKWKGEMTQEELVADIVNELN